VRPERTSSPSARALSPAARAFAPATRGFSPAARGFSPAARAFDAPDPSRVLVIGCGALARELVEVMDQAGLSNVDLTCLPATLHNRPGGIPAAVRAKIRAARPRYERIFIAYADCGTGGLLDAMLADEGVERLPGAHCYEVYAGSQAFAAMSVEEPGTFYLTDFLARNFDRLVIAGLGLDRHPELLPTYFGNYRRLVYLAQTDDPGLVRAARRAARQLGLAFELRRTGYGDLATSLIGTAGSTVVSAKGSNPDALAPDATNVAHRPGAAPNSVDSFHRRQRCGARIGRRDRSFRPIQEPSPSQVVGRRNVHSVQRVARELHQTQDPAEIATTTAATGAAPGALKSGPSTTGAA
jgi:Protein of unknown function (DUF1638)